MSDVFRKEMYNWLYDESVHDVYNDNNVSVAGRTGWVSPLPVTRQSADRTKPDALTRRVSMRDNAPT